MAQNNRSLHSTIDHGNGQSQKTVALALGSGGARGAAHIGVIDAIERRGYKIIAVSGCSMGAIIGGFYSAQKLPEFRQWITQLSYLDMLRMVDISLLSSSMIRGDRVFKILSEMLGGRQIEDCQIPFTAVATDLIRRKEVWFQQGDLDEALRASSAIPTILSPVTQRGRVLVDGGVLNPLPISPCVSAHADLIIAVDLNGDVPAPLTVKDMDSGVTQSNRHESGSDEKIASSGPTAEASDSSTLGSDWWQSISELGTALIDKFDSKQQDYSELSPQIKASQESIANDLGKLGILNQMFEVMQKSLSQYKTAGYPPDLLIRMPAEICESHDFHRAAEVIKLGESVADLALDAFEQGQSSVYGQMH